MKTTMQDDTETVRALFAELTRLEHEQAEWVARGDVDYNDPAALATVCDVLSEQFHATGDIRIFRTGVEAHVALDRLRSRLGLDTEPFDEHAVTLRVQEYLLRGRCLDLSEAAFGQCAVLRREGGRFLAFAFCIGCEAEGDVLEDLGSDVEGVLATLERLAKTPSDRAPTLLPCDEVGPDGRKNPDQIRCLVGPWNAFNGA